MVLSDKPQAYLYYIVLLSTLWDPGVWKVFGALQTLPDCRAGAASPGTTATVGCTTLHPTLYWAACTFSTSGATQLV